MSIQNKRLILLIAIGVASVAAVLTFVFRPKEQPLGHGGPLESVGYTAFATSTLTNSFTAGGSVSSSIMLSEGMPNISIAGTYTPKSAGGQALILLERSIDKGLTFKPYMTLTSETGDILVNASGSSTTNGSPFIIPQAGTATSGTTLGFSFDLSLAADYIRLSAKESATSTAGQLSAQVLLTSN